MITCEILICPTKNDMYSQNPVVQDKALSCVWCTRNCAKCENVQCPTVISNPINSVCVFWTLEYALPVRVQATQVLCT